MARAGYGRITNIIRQHSKLTPAEIREILLKEGIKTTLGSISSTKYQLKRKGLDAPKSKTGLPPHSKLWSRRSIIKKVIYYNQNATQRQLVAKLAENGVKISQQEVAFARSKMRKEGIIPPAEKKKVPKLTPEKEQLRQEMIKVMQRQLNYWRRRYGINADFFEDILLEAEFCSYNFAERYDPNRASLNTYTYPKTRGLVLGMIREKIRKEMGLSVRDGARIFALAIGRNRGETPEKTIARVKSLHGTSLREAQELLSSFDEYNKTRSLDIDKV